MQTDFLNSLYFAVVLSALLFPEHLAARAPIDLGPPGLSDAECKVSPVDGQHLFVAAGVMQGDTLTNVQLADPNSMSTIVRVEIRAGSAPLTLFLHSDGGVIWEFTGEVSRIKRAIIAPSSKDRRVGVIGFPSERLEFPEFARCPQGRMFPPGEVPDANRDKAFEFFFGRRPDQVAFNGHPNRLTLPAAEFVMTPDKTPKDVIFIRKDTAGNSIRTLATQDADGKPVERFLHDRRSDAEYDLTTYHRGGFRRIDAKALISPVNVIEPVTYPGHAGLIQLEQANSIRPARRDDVDALNNALGRKGLRIDYVITGGIMIPPGLHGAYTKNFLVPTGIPAPEGNPGHGCVYFADARAPMGYRC